MASAASTRPSNSSHSTTTQLTTLEALLAISVAERDLALTRAADIVAKAFDADKVDTFVYDPNRDSLVAVGSSLQPLSDMQRKHGLDILPLANKGRTVEVFTSGRTFLEPEVESDESELPGIRDTLKVRSQIGVPLIVEQKRMGVLFLASQTPRKWSETDARFAETVGKWVSAVLHQTMLVRELEKNAAFAGRRTAAEELITVFAHDIRNFLSPVSLSMHVLKSRAERDGRLDDVRDVERARRGIDRLSAIVNDVLDVARLDRGLMTVELEPCPLGTLIEELAAIMTTPEKPVRVILKSGNPLVRLDAARIRQCLENVVGNAIKHSPKHAPVEIVVSTGRKEDDDRNWAKVEIFDSGPGVAPEILPHMFEPFVTNSGHAHGGAPAGLGLGLYLAREIARIHEGSLNVRSEPGRGTCFTLEIPTAARTP